MLNPSDSVVDWVLSVVPQMGAGWCPPGMLGIGIGGTAEKAMLLAKEALPEPVDIQELRERGAGNRAEQLRLELMDKVNALGIGAQGLGGLTTVLDIKIKDYPTHAANKAVAIIPTVRPHAIRISLWMAAALRCKLRLHYPIGQRSVGKWATACAGWT